jgi:2-O-methyltransferase
MTLTMRNFLRRGLASIRYRLGLNKDDRYALGLIPLQDFKRFLPTNPVIVEAGASDGGDTVNLAQMWPTGKVHAFEPVPAAFDELLQRSAGLPNVHCYPLALSDSVGTREMHLSSGRSNSSSSLHAPKAHLEDHPEVLFEETIAVTTTTLPEWQRAYQVDRVDFLWLDMQGHELTVLKAATKTLPTVQAVYTEVSLKETYEGVPLYGEVKEWMRGQGFSVQIEALPWPDMGNVLFVRDQMAS